LRCCSEQDLDDDNLCLVRRIIGRSGRSRAYVNGSPVPLGVVKSIGERLLDIHGQHAHQSLLRPASQRELLDGFGQLADQAQATASAFNRWQETVTAYERLVAQSADRASRLDYLAFQLDELDAIDCDPESLATIEAEHGRLSHAAQLRDDSQRVLMDLDDDESSAHRLLSRAAHTLVELATIDPELAEIRDLVDSAAIQVDEAASGLRHYQAKVDLDPARLAEIDAQLARWHELARKHRVAPEALGTLRDELRTELETLTHTESNLQQLAAERDAAAESYQDAAEALSQARQAAAARLADIVTTSMASLGMKGGRFEIAVTPRPDRPAAHGFDLVTFEVAANPGQSPAALASVASGGELSRISLAIQVAAAHCTHVPTLVFDEVDVGIGGATAEIVGQLLRRLGLDRQVLCVTHLPQVASQAHHQLRVIKTSDGQTTETRIEALREAERIDEIARMLGGVSVTEQTRRHADEMIRSAQATE
jgi:DNA repair protein RecN (Recombination protein N)